MQFLRFRDLREKKGIPFSRVHIDRLEKAGKFPRRIRFGDNTVVWGEDEIDAHIAACKAARDGVGEAAA